MKSIDEKVLNVYVNSILNERKFDLGAGHKGNGITVWNRAKEVHGDYETVAHIDSNRKIKYYIKNPPKEVKSYVEKIAKGKNPSVSTSQKDQKVFKESIINEGEFIDDSKKSDAIFKELEVAANKLIMKKIIPEMKKVQDKIYKKYEVDDNSTMSVKYFGTAMIHDVFRQILGQELLSVRGGLKRIMR